MLTNYSRCVTLIIVFSLLCSCLYANGPQCCCKIVNQVSKMTHITLILSSLHWLPICFRIYYKVLAITFRALHGQAPEHIMDLIHPYVTSGSLRSSNQDLPAVPRSRLKTKGDCAFVFVAPTLWNSLPCTYTVSSLYRCF